jgi:hypothetical protein
MLEIGRRKRLGKQGANSNIKKLQDKQSYEPEAFTVIKRVVS